MYSMKYISFTLLLLLIYCGCSKQKNEPATVHAAVTSPTLLTKKDTEVAPIVEALQEQSETNLFEGKTEEPEIDRKFIEPKIDRKPRLPNTP